MAKRSDGPVVPAKNSNASRGPGSRWVTLGFGVALGFAWGSVMWAIATGLGQDTGGVRGWLYLAISMAMIGGGIAGVVGAVGAKKSGERISPRFRRR